MGNNKVQLWELDLDCLLGPKSYTNIYQAKISAEWHPLGFYQD